MRRLRWEVLGSIAHAREDVHSTSRAVLPEKGLYPGRWPAKELSTCMSTAACQRFLESNEQVCKRLVVLCAGKQATSAVENCSAKNWEVANSYPRYSVLGTRRTAAKG